MGCTRPATPGLLVSISAIVCLALVSFSVPYLQSIYFLNASISSSDYYNSFGVDILIGTLGFCLNFSNGTTTCSKPTIGYDLGLNNLLQVDGNNVQLPSLSAKWFTYALFLHVIALVLAAGTAFFGLLAHLREMSVSCCSIFVAVLAAVVALVAFIFDIALFFVAKASMSSLGIGTVSIGPAVWLTLSSWILLFISCCFFAVGVCCINRRPRGLDSGSRRDGREEQHRLDAIRAEAERKALQAKPESGLPAFHETQPLTAVTDGDAVYFDPYRDSHSPITASSQSSRAGYTPAVEGTRAIDDYYSTPAAGYLSQHQPTRKNSVATATTSLYPSTISTASPPPRQPSMHTLSYHQPQAQVASPPPVNPYYNDTPYGHGQQASSYSPIPIHQRQPSAYSQQSPDPYATRHLQHQGSYQSYQPSSALYNPYTQTDNQATYNSPITQQRSFTLGGDGYGSPPPAERQHTQPGPVYQSPIVAPLNTNAGYVSPIIMSPTGPRPQPPLTPQPEEAPPPSYVEENVHWAQ